MELINRMIMRIIEFFKRKSAKGIFYINGPDNLPPPLSKDEEEKTFALFEKGSTEAKNAK